MSSAARADGAASRTKARTAAGSRNTGRVGIHAAVGAGVIFDCDGVLVDTEPVANRVLAELLTEHGLPTTTEQTMERYMGRSMASSIAISEELLGGPLPDDFAAGYYAILGE